MGVVYNALRGVEMRSKLYSGNGGRIPTFPVHVSYGWFSLIIHMT